MTFDEPKAKHNIAVRLFETVSVHGPDPLKILLLKLDHIGDFITAIDAFRILRDKFFNAEITLICLPSVATLAETTGLFNHVKGFAAIPDSSQFGKVPGMYAEDRIVRFQSLLEGSYFLAADFKHDPFDRFGLDHVDAHCRAAFAAQTQKGIDIVIPTMEWDAPALSVIGGKGKNLPVSAKVRMNLLAYAIVESLVEKPCASAVFGLHDGINENPLYQTLCDNKQLKIGVSLGAGSELRKWNTDYWAALLPRLMQTHAARAIFFGSEADKEETQALIARLPLGSCLDLTGMMPLSHVPAYMKVLDAYIGCDTGLTHLAGQLGLPTVNIFAGISNVSVWRAQGPRVKTIYAEVVCAPCHLRFKKDCPNNNICMGAILPDIVYACFEQVITFPTEKTRQDGKT